MNSLEMRKPQSGTGSKSGVGGDVRRGARDGSDTTATGCATREAFRYAEETLDVILAAGDGRRPQRLARMICGDNRPETVLSLGRQRHLAGAEAKEGRTEYPVGVDLAARLTKPAVA